MLLVQLSTDFNFHAFLLLILVLPRARSCCASHPLSTTPDITAYRPFVSIESSRYNLLIRQTARQVALIVKMKVSATVVALAFAGSVVAAPSSWGADPYTTSTSAWEPYTTSTAYESTTTAEAAYTDSADWASWDPSYSSSTEYPASVSYTTTVVNSLTTFCPYATTITHGPQTYTVTAAATLTITDCPCTLTLPVYTSTSVACSTWYERFISHNVTKHLS
jgi:hypothetical protein